MEEFFAIFKPQSIPVVAFTFGFFCLIAALGITSGIKLGLLSFPSPTDKKRRNQLGVLGICLIVFSLIASHLIADWKPSLEKELIYNGDDSQQIAVDGEDIYLLKKNGNIYRISQSGLQLLIEDSQAKQIEPAGGMLYILHQSGNISSLKSVLRNLNRENTRMLIDNGTGTQQIVSVGETLYILKKNGEVWKFSTYTQESVTPIKPGFYRIDDGTNTSQIASSGSILYILKAQNGHIWQYVPTLNQERPFEEIYRPQTEAEKAKSLAADGGTLYFTDAVKRTWRYKEQASVIEKNAGARKIAAVDGFMYILTDAGNIIRYFSPKNEAKKLTDAGSDNRDIAIYGKDIYVIKNDGKVWRYSEFILKRSK
jgi:hypothetical protein